MGQSDKKRIRRAIQMPKLQSQLGNYQSLNGNMPTSKATLGES